jgi:hypothetical protein
MLLINLDSAERLGNYRRVFRRNIRGDRTALMFGRVWDQVRVLLKVIEIFLEHF